MRAAVNATSRQPANQGRAASVPAPLLVQPSPPTFPPAAVAWRRTIRQVPGSVHLVDWPGQPISVLAKEEVIDDEVIPCR